ncbi:MAG TPA: alpha/beta fold hydrolase BchO [Rhodopseudomonas sp.]|uniref:alpha/beta fold hydrolase BchO n=1 Tax=Rhodopseudomonas sp. TaxID=1078 RepID=UPI002ED81074
MRPIPTELPAAAPRRAELHAKPRWDHEGRDWPNRESSRFVQAAGLRWHVQQMGRGPLLLLVHGTGAATHSWRALAPLLAEHFTVVAPDLPGHGFTETPPAKRLSLDGMAEDLAGLLRVLDLAPVLVAGHSAGAAVLARMCLDGAIAPDGLFGLNGAMLPIGGLAGRLMTPFAQLLAGSRVVPRLFARFASSDSFVERMIADTGSVLDPAGIEFYRRLTCSPGHVASALRMMGNWKLRPLAAELPRLLTRLVLVSGGNDKTIAPHDAARVHALVPGSRVVTMPGLGHLAHEERPHEVSDLIIEFARHGGLLPPLLAGAAE